MEECDLCNRPFEYDPNNDWDWGDYHFCSLGCANAGWEDMCEAAGVNGY